MFSYYPELNVMFVLLAIFVSIADRIYSKKLCWQKSYLNYVDIKIRGVCY